jgi:thiamine biosynthesis protein ThiI
MDPQVLANAVAARVETPVHALMDSTSTPEEIELVRTPSVGDVVIDIRHPAEEEREPLTLTNNEVLKIPFYELNQRMEALPRDRQYLLFCDRGTMSRLHAGHLKAEGYDNVKVYSPAA